MNYKEIQNLDDLILLIENWESVGGEGYCYDINGLWAIFTACLRNLKKNGIDGDFEDLTEVIYPEEVEVLKKIMKGLEQNHLKF